MNAFADILEAIGHAPIEKRAITNHGVLNEAYAYANPSSFSARHEIDIGGVAILLISGTPRSTSTASVFTSAIFPRNCGRTFDNITGLLEAEGCTWHDIVPHQLLPAGHRSRLRRFQCRTHRVLKEQGLDPAARVYRHSSASLPSRDACRDRSHCHVRTDKAWLHKELAVMRRMVAGCGLRDGRGSALLILPRRVRARIRAKPRAQDESPITVTGKGTCECGAHPPGPPRDRVGRAIRGEARDLSPL